MTESVINRYDVVVDNPHPRPSGSRDSRDVFQDERTVRVVAALLLLGFLFNSVVAVVAVAVGSPLLALVETGFSCIVIACAAGVAFHRRRAACWLFLAVVATGVLPNLGAWLSGGFEGSGGRGIWSFLSILGALLLWRGRVAIALFALFVVSQIVQLDVASPHPPLPESARTAMQHLHLLGMFLCTFVLYEVFRRRFESQRQTLWRQETDRKAVEIKSEIINVMSHEIRTPLSAIIGLLDLMSTDRMEPDQADNLRTVQFASGNLLHLVNDVLDYSKLQEGALQIESIPFDAERTMRNVVRSQENAALGGDVKLVGTWEGGDATWVLGDPVRFAQIVTNLVSNGIKFSPRGKVEVRCGRNDGFLRISVSDNGTGIPPERQKLVFKPFEQADASTSRQFGGTGLGLAIVEKIVQISGGEIRLRSAVGQGSTFEVDLPWPEAPVEASAAVNRPLVPWRILLVDDNALNTRVAERLLQRMGQIVHSVSGGEAAIAWLEGHSCDLIFMDLQMPGLDGFATTRLIRQRWGAAVPIVALSAEVMQQVQERVEHAGMQGFLAKPISAERLQHCVAERQRSAAR